MKNKGKTNDEYEKFISNRQKKRMPRLGLFWCSCDGNLVWSGLKCSVCGRKNIKCKRDKK